MKGVIHRDSIQTLLSPMDPPKRGVAHHPRSCGYERKCREAWAATATAKLPAEHLGDKSVEHGTTITEPPKFGQQLPLT